jgi:hypothetical protein
MKFNDPAFPGWEFHCVECNHALPVDLKGKIHRNRQYCPDCFAAMMDGKAQSEIPDNWQERCSFDFMRKNFLHLYQKMKTSYIASLDNQY